MATLTRQEMEQVITGGGSVLHEGRIHDRIDTLPDEADLAQGDEARTNAARDAIDSQIASLTAQRAKLDAPDTTTPAGQERTKKAKPAVSTETALDSNNTQPGASNWP